MYYARVPAGSGAFTLHDPRGASPYHPEAPPLPNKAPPPRGPTLHAFISPRRVDQPPPSGGAVPPPFDVVATVAPTEGDLLVFPGWLVHSVAPSPSPSPRDAADAGPRVSLSLNLPGPWRRAADLGYTLPM